MGNHINIHAITSAQSSSVTQSCPTPCDSFDCRTPGFPVHHQLPELAQTQVHRVDDAVPSSYSVVPFSSCLQSFPASGSFPISQFFASGTGVAASVLKDISSEYSLEGLMLKLQYLMQRTDSLEKTLMLGKTEGRRRREQQR